MRLHLGRGRVFLGLAVSAALIQARRRNEPTLGGSSGSSQFSVVYAALNYFGETVISARGMRGRLMNLKGAA